MKHAWLTAIAGLALVWPAAAQEPDCADPVTQLDMNICAGNDFVDADDALNASYGEVVAAMEEKDAEMRDLSPDLIGAVEALKKAQRGWIAYRDGHCEAVGFEARGGSMEPMLVSACMAELTRTRTKELEALLGEEAQ